MRKKKDETSVSYVEVLKMKKSYESRMTELRKQYN